MLARLDIAKLLGTEKALNDADVIRSIDFIARHAASVARQGIMDGLVFANWQTHLPPTVCNRLLAHVNSLDLQVFLEVAPPGYLDPTECLEIDMNLIKGIIFRNGTIMRNGDRRNYFQMEDMRRGIRALAKVSFKGDTTVMIWDTIDDGIELSHAVAKRSFNWCRFHCVISWIGPEAALNDARIAIDQTQVEEPLGALMWLKTNTTVSAHEAWRLNDRVLLKRTCDDQDSLAVYRPLEQYIPNLRARLQPRSRVQPHRAAGPTVDATFEWPAEVVESRTNPVTSFPGGLRYKGLGYFHLGLNVSAQAFANLVDGQRRLRDLNLLDRLGPQELADMADKLFIREDDCQNAVVELKLLLSEARGTEDDRLKVYVGLHSGFRDGVTGHFWGLFDVDSRTGCIDLYINAKSANRLGSILHTYLSSRNVARDQCFLAEYRQSEHAGELSEKWNLPNSIVRDIEQLTPVENLLFLRRLVRTDEFDHDLEFLRTRIVACCEYQLLEVPTLQQYRALCSSTYLDGGISADELVKSRLAWHAQNGLDHPDVSDAISLFTEVDALLPTLLKRRQSGFIDSLEAVSAEILQKGKIDVSADIFALAIFSAFKRLALDEVYLEVLDRNPLPNPQPDQPACLAEMFALGSQCQAYFDMTSNVLGTILAKRYHNYCLENQPPRRDDSFTELPTAYYSTQVDIDMTPEKPTVSAYYRVTFLGIFAAPALVDILLLSTIGRGLYLTTYMSSDEKSMATAGLMTALLLCGAISTWIGSGGTYYLNAMAYPALNMFVLTRLTAGVAVSLFVGLVALIAVGFVKGFYSGLIFFLYLVCLSTYLNLLGTLSIYQYPGFAFRSGRTVVITCIPILFISPILTLLIGHDIVVYLCVLYGFLTAVILGTRRIVSQWGSWYLDIPFVSDTEIVAWYSKTEESTQVIKTLPPGTDLAATPFPRMALMAEILKEHKRKPWTKSTADNLVKRLENGFEATLLLMDWYSTYTRTAMPYKFSPTWNLQCKAAVDTLKDMQKGLKLHNAFLHWRQGSDAVWCGFLYFVIALMDKWVFLITGGSLVGLSTNTAFRLAVGFGLAYYLVAAVCLDSVAQPLWTLAQKTTDQPITSLQFLREAAVNDARARRKLYWSNLVKFFLMHGWALSVTAAIMWTFEGSRDGVIMFVAYIGAYSGLLFYQYNRIFAGTRALKDLVTASIIGILGGSVLVRTLPEFQYGGVATLALATWTTALLSLWSADIGWPRSRDAQSEKASRSTFSIYQSGALASRCDFTQAECLETFESTTNPNQGQAYRVQPTVYPGTEVANAIAIAAETTRGHLLSEAFPNARFLLCEAIRLWRSGEVTVDLVTQDRLLRPEQRRIRVITQDDGNLLRLVVFIHRDGTPQVQALDVLRHRNLIAEAILHATAFLRLKLSRSDSGLTATLLARPEGAQSLAIPEGIKQQLELYPTESRRSIEDENKELLSHVLLGLNADHDWDMSPACLRKDLLDRWEGKTSRLTAEDATWLSERFGRQDNLQRVARGNLGAALAILVGSHAKSMLGVDSEKDLVSLSSSVTDEWLVEAERLATAKQHNSHFLDICLYGFRRVFDGARFALKFLVISTVADPEYQRELDYVLADKPFLVRWPAKTVLIGIWLYCKTLQRIILPVFLVSTFLCRRSGVI